MGPYYTRAGVTLYHGSALDHTDTWTAATALITDPPYGIAHLTSAFRGGPRTPITGDQDTQIRDAAIAAWHTTNGTSRPAVVFGSWKAPRPPQTKQRLVWHKAGNTMRHLPLAFRPIDEEIYIWGQGWMRTTRAPGSVITTTESRPIETRRLGHPTPKPIDLLQEIMSRLEPVPGGHVIADPFAGSGATLVAAALMGHRAVGVELEERYCEQTARRLDYILDHGVDAPRSVVVYD